MRVQSDRDGIGARVCVRSGNTVQHATVRSGESDLSVNDPRIHFELGTNAKVDEIEIRRPNGTVDRISDGEPDQFLTVAEGKEIVRATKAGKGGQ